MITTDDVIDLLSMASTYDQRNVGEMDVRAWYLVAVRERWTVPAAQRVLVDYYSHDASRPRITPPAVSDGIRAARRRAATAFVPPRIPDELPAGEYPAWYRTQLAAFVDDAIDGWADGGELPMEARELQPGPVALRLEQAPAPVREEIQRHLRRIGSPRPSSPTARTGPSPRDLDPNRRAAARAELDAVRPTTTDQAGQHSA